KTTDTETTIRSSRHNYCRIEIRAAPGGRHRQGHVIGETGDRGDRLTQKMSGVLYTCTRCQGKHGTSLLRLVGNRQVVGNRQ
ncbi:hypothetical protein BaRGS_00038238, partial [Batillaria attramentaria]